MYHDIIDEGDSFDSSGFPGAGAAIYKLGLRTFQGHLDLISNHVPAPPIVLDISSINHGEEKNLAAPGAWCITFDDGGISAWENAAGLLESKGWRGHFFITTARIGQPGFLDQKQILDLHNRGHVIGSHSHTHPPRLSALSEKEIASEWHTSLNILREITGEDSLVASVPGGFYSKIVGRTAAAAGIRRLFTSEPVSHPTKLEDCFLLGRYSIKKGATAKTAAALASGAARKVLMMRLEWALLGVAKRLGGQTYLDLRKTLLRH